MRRPGWGTEVALLALAALLLVGWDLSEADRAVMSLFGTAHGFVWRRAFVTQVLPHDGGRWMSAVALSAWGAWAASSLPGPPRAQRWRALGLAMLAMGLVPLLKQASTTSCPWDWAEFGGQARWVSHWVPGLRDGGPGHCFPSGHAAAAFAFLPGYYMLRPRFGSAARWWLLGCVSMGVAFGAAQVLRGAHAPSHVLWTAWLCAALGVAGQRRWVVAGLQLDTSVASQVMSPREPPVLENQPAIRSASSSSTASSSRPLRFRT